MLHGGDAERPAGYARDSLKSLPDDAKISSVSKNTKNDKLNAPLRSQTEKKTFNSQRIEALWIPVTVLSTHVSNENLSAVKPAHHQAAHTIQKSKVRRPKPNAYVSEMQLKTIVQQTFNPETCR